MFLQHPIPPKQPRRVRSGERAIVRETSGTVRGVHRVTSGQRRPIGTRGPDEPEGVARAGRGRRVPPAYARRRS